MVEDIKKKDLLKLIPVAVVAIPLFSYLIWNTVRWNQREEYFKNTKINSRILELTDIKRGSYLIKLNVDDSVMEFALPISYKVKKDSISVGDSLAKSALNGKFEIYRTIDGKEIIKVSESIIY